MAFPRGPDDNYFWLIITNNGKNGIGKGVMDLEKVEREPEWKGGYDLD